MPKTSVKSYPLKNYHHSCPFIKPKTALSGVKIVGALLDYQGAGHNAAIQIGSQTDPFINEFGDKIKSARILVNQPDSIGGIGDIYTDALRPSLTLEQDHGEKFIVT